MTTWENRTKTYIFSIAEFSVKIVFKDACANDIGLIPAFLNFRSSEKYCEPLFQLTVEDSGFVFPDALENIGTFDTGNGDAIVDKYEDGGYKFIIKDTQNEICCVLVSDKKFTTCRCTLNGDIYMRQFGLNSALMLCFAFVGSFHQSLLIHASLVRNNGRGYAFTAKSGTGKSTHTSLWLKYISGCDLMNDDNPVIRIVNGKPFIYGSPWSGKTPCYRQVKAPLGAITRIDRAKQNSIEKLRPVQAFASLLPCCSSMKWDEDIYNAICDTITRIIETTGIYTLHCLPDKEAAMLCYREVSK